MKSLAQWGVGLAKVRAKDIEGRRGGGDVARLDGSTAGLLGRLRNAA